MRKDDAKYNAYFAWRARLHVEDRLVTASRKCLVVVLAFSFCGSLVVVVIGCGVWE